MNEEFQINKAESGGIASASCGSGKVRGDGSATLARLQERRQRYERDLKAVTAEIEAQGQRVEERKIRKLEARKRQEQAAIKSAPQKPAAGSGEVAGT
jgi:hypothetical protein